MRIICYLLALLLLVCPVKLAAQETIIASVSPEFPNGLHAKYLRFLAKELNVALKIKPIPLARRIKELEKGDIDIIVLAKRDNPELIALMPSYSQIDENLFVRASEKHRISNQEQLRSALIGVSHGSHLPQFVGNRELANTVEVNSLEQKVLMLKRKRIDGFFHTFSSANLVINEMGASDAIVSSVWQPGRKKRLSHFVISKKSRLFKYKAQLEQIIQQAKNEGKFIQIRQQHYQSKN
ncbi:substrate-binding periplasmic protein [Thalassotalea euphylliae]|uniref:substrate-binding periplasmic protein n=1 Tax=Thalassotalea euphylliae TaxID=1655234 RepID=UPI0015F26390|nr:transporter substrate-binding domain-containing protein [Thalassotalea euphylliae]